VPQILATRPDLAQAHDLEILAAAPEFANVITSQRETLTSTASPKTRTRYYPHAHTTRIGHGITSLLKAYLSDIDEPQTLVVNHVDDADSTDIEWLATMLRRIDPRRLRLVVRTTRNDQPQPLATALLAYADQLDALADEPNPTPPAAAAAAALAAQYVAGDCVGDDPAPRLAYASLDPATRAALHDVRANELAVRDELSLRLGAIVYHRVHGSDRTAALDALDTAIEHCMMKGYYTAVLELGAALCGLADWSTEHERRWLATTKMATALSVMARADEALALFDAACAASTSRSVHMQAAYGRAMLFTRYFEPERRNLTLARAWINTALVIADGAPDAKRRAYNLTFNENGLALIAMHLGDPEEALQLVDGGLKRMAAELSASEQGQHASVLRHNRTQLLARMGRTADAIEQYAAVIDADPNHSDYYFERAALLRHLGHFDEALRDYDTLIRLALPYPESYYNRGDLRAETGDTDGALADFDMVLELDPTYLDGWVNRAALRYAAADVAGAAADVAAGLALDAAQPQLLSLRGILAIDDGRIDDARAALRAALHADPGLAAAWANLGVLHHEQGDLAEAVRCYDRSLDLLADGDVAMNRDLAVAALAQAVAPDR
jgi:tetratricopeptide (TPR) repeat protein